MVEGRVLVVDDDYSIRRLLTVSLRGMGYVSELAKNGSDALQALKSGEKIDLVLLDVEMPGMSGIELLQVIRSSKERYANVPVLIVTSHSDHQIVAKAIGYGAQDFIVKPFDVGLLLHKVSRWVSVQSEVKWNQLSQNQERALRLTLATLDDIQRNAENNMPIDYSQAAECGQVVTEVVDSGEVDGVLGALKDHDGYTFVHSMRTGIYLALFARALQFSEEEMQILATGGILHDIGKAKTPLGILNKPGKLNPDEWIEMRAHVDHTVSILKGRPDVPDQVLEIAWCHHEKMNGSSYPRGLKASETSELARMSAICDVYIALTDRRTYKPAWEPKRAFEVLRSKDHFDQRLVAIFVQQVFRWSKRKEIKRGK